jgi:hypothetical protein
VELVGKLTDALRMFWETCDEHERRLLIYAAAYLVAVILIGLQRSRDERLRRVIVEELRGAGAG